MVGNQHATSWVVRYRDRIRDDNGRGENTQSHRSDVNDRQCKHDADAPSNVLGRFGSEVGSEKLRKSLEIRPYFSPPVTSRSSFLVDLDAPRNKSLQTFDGILKRQPERWLK